MDLAAEADRPASAGDVRTVTARGITVTRTAEPFAEQILDVVCTQPGVAALFLRSGLDTTFPLYPSVRAAEAGRG